MQTDIAPANNWIVLNLTNINQSEASTCNLFKLPDNNSSAVSNGQVVAGLTTADLGTAFAIEYTKDGNQSTAVTGALSTAQELVDYINVLFEGNVSYYTELIPTELVFYSFSSVYTLDSIFGFVNGKQVSTPLALNIINGSFVNVEVEGLDLTYNELTTELTFQPYKIEMANVYANNITQANRPFKVNNVEITGHVNSRQVRPGLSPMTKQFVNENIPLKFSPNPTSALSYTLGPGESIRLILAYINKDLVALPIKQIFVPVQELSELPLIIKDARTSIIPMFELVKKHLNQPNAFLIKKIIKPFLKERAITKGEVFSAFGGNDYKEI